MVRYVLLASLAACGARPSPVASPAPRGYPRTPCFPNLPPLSADEIYRDLAGHFPTWTRPEDVAWPEPLRYGTCTVARGTITEADGSLVAELSCGVRVLREGISDGNGLEIGARGADVLARHRSPTPLRCVGDGTARVRCAFDRATAQDDAGSSYLVAGTLGDAPLHGTPANDFFRDKRVVEMLVSLWCQ